MQKTIASHKLERKKNKKRLENKRDRNITMQNEPKQRKRKMFIRQHLGSQKQKKRWMSTGKIDNFKCTIRIKHSFLKMNGMLFTAC